MRSLQEILDTMANVFFCPQIAQFSLFWPSGVSALGLGSETETQKLLHTLQRLPLGHVLGVCAVKFYFHYKCVCCLCTLCSNCSWTKKQGNQTKKSCHFSTIFTVVLIAAARIAFFVFCLYLVCCFTGRVPFCYLLCRWFCYVLHYK